MQNEDKFHVMFLTRQQQLALRLTLVDLLAKHVRLNLDRLMTGMLDAFGNRVQGVGTANDLAETVRDSGDAAYVSIMSGLDMYERIVDPLPTHSSMPKAKDCTMQLYVRSMEFVVKAVNLWDKDNCSLTPGEIAIVSGNIDGLRKLINESKKYVYTDEDVRRVTRGGKR